MRECKINSEGSHALAEGMIKNTTLKYLDLASNKLKADSLDRWDPLGKTSISYLDLSFNDLDDQGVLCLIRALQNTREIKSQNDSYLSGKEEACLEVLNLKGV